MRLLVHIGYKDFLLDEGQSIDQTLAVLNSLKEVEEKYYNGYKYEPVENAGEITYRFIEDRQIVEPEPVQFEEDPGVLNDIDA